MATSPSARSFLMAATLSRHQVPEGLVDSHALSHGIGHALVITGQHDELRHAEFAKSCNHWPRRAGRVHQSDRPEIAIAMAHDEHRAALHLQRVDLLAQARRQ
jgi:hypothetical protein